MGRMTPCHVFYPSGRQTRSGTTGRDVRIPTEETTAPKSLASASKRDLAQFCVLLRTGTRSSSFRLAADVRARRAEHHPS